MTAMLRCRDPNLLHLPLLKTRVCILWKLWVQEKSPSSILSTYQADGKHSQGRRSKQGALEGTPEFPEKASDTGTPGRMGKEERPIRLWGESQEREERTTKHKMAKPDVHLAGMA